MKTRTYEDFPKTRYQGSKKSLLGWLSDELSELEFDTFLDVFGGTGSVSYLAKTMGKEVTFNDYLASNAVSARALIKNSRVGVKPFEIKPYFEMERAEGVVSRVFKDVFFTDEENLSIDTVINGINNDPNFRLSGLKRDIALHSFFQALLMKRPFNLFHRANLYIRTAKCRRNFGNKTTWETPIEELMTRNLIEANHAVFDNGKKNNVLNKDALKLKCGYDLVYIDPPYYSPQSNHCVDYFTYYSFLEGLCSYDKWESRINHELKILPMKIKTPSFKRAVFMEDMKSLFATHSESIIVLSYKSPGLTSIHELTTAVTDTHKAPIVHATEHTYSLNKNNGHYLENLIIAYPNR